MPDSIEIEMGVCWHAGQAHKGDALSKQRGSSNHRVAARGGRLPRLCNQAPAGDHGWGLVQAGCTAAAHPA